jgi:hypothetical protein
MARVPRPYGSGGGRGAGVPLNATRIFAVLASLPGMVSPVVAHTARVRTKEGDRRAREAAPSSRRRLNSPPIEANRPVDIRCTVLSLANLMNGERSTQMNAREDRSVRAVPDLDR